MFEKVIDLTGDDRIFIRDGNDDCCGCGNVNNDGHLYYINQLQNKAYQLPDKYKDTPIILYHPCGGLSDGMIMVSLLGEIDLQYHHTFFDVAGLWGWLDLNGNEIIAPQYVYAMSFYEGRAIVCKGEWSINDQGQYWCENEGWGMIDRSGNEIVPCIYDEIFNIENTDRYLLCHKGGWKNGCYCINDIEEKAELVELNFYFDNGYMFNTCFYSNGYIVFDEHIAGEEQNIVNIFDVKTSTWSTENQIRPSETLNGQTKITVKASDDEEIIVY